MAAEPTPKTLTPEERAARINAAYRAPLPTIAQFLDDPFYMGSLSKPHGRQREVLEDVFGLGATYRDVCLDCGRGWGKSYVVSVAILYAAYRVLCLRNPQDYYGIGTGSPISIVNVSISEGQAKRVVFGEVLGKIDRMPCFAQPGFERNTRITSALQWPDQSLTIRPSSSNPKGDLGANIILAVMDEASWFRDVQYSMREAGMQEQGRFDEAEAMYNLMTPAVRRRGNAKWRRDAMFLMISSPCYVDDFLERQLARASEFPSIYALRSPSWEGHEAGQLSGKTFDDPQIGPVPVEYTEEFRANPEQARRMYGAVPSEAIGGFFSDPSIIPAHCNYERETPLVGPETFVSDFSGVGKPPLYVHVDLGLKRDACGLAGAYAGTPGVVAAFYTRITPDQHGGEIDFARVRQFILNLRDRHGWRLARVTFDGWQSVDSRQQLQREGIPTGELSVDRNTEAYDTLKELIANGALDYYEDEFLFGELSRLELIKGRKVDHPPRGSKDVADGLAGAVFQAAQGIRNVTSAATDIPKLPMQDGSDQSARRVKKQASWLTEQVGDNPYSVPKLEPRDPTH